MFGYWNKRSSRNFGSGGGIEVSPIVDPGIQANRRRVPINGQAALIYSLAGSRRSLPY